MLWFFALVTRYTIIRCFTTIHNSGKREKEREIKGCWDGGAVTGKVLPYQASHGVGRRECGVGGTAPAPLVGRPANQFYFLSRKTSRVPSVHAPSTFYVHYLT